MEGASALHFSVSLSDYGYEKQAAYVCRNCKHLSVATEWVERDNRAPGVFGGATAADEEVWVNPSWRPVWGEQREFPDVPRHISEAASEATLCLAVGAHRAAGSLARAVVEAIAKDKGAGGGNLAARIDALREADHIREHTKEQAHEVRHFGNGMAHGDFVEPTTAEEAEEVIELMAEVLDEVYQSPARLKRRRAARLGKDSTG